MDYAAGAIVAAALLIKLLVLVLHGTDAERGGSRWLRSSSFFPARMKLRVVRWWCCKFAQITGFACCVLA